MEILGRSGYLKSNLDDTIIKKVDKEKELVNQKVKLENEVNIDKELIDSILATLKQIEKNVIKFFYLSHTSISEISKITNRQEQTIRYIKMHSLKKCDEFIQKSTIQQNFNKISTENQ